MKRDVILVDKPGGDGPTSLRKMGSVFLIEIALVNGTNVVVHDVGRMIKKWFFFLGVFDP